MSEYFDVYKPLCLSLVPNATQKGGRKGPGVDGGSPVTQPCVVVADVVDEHVLVGLGCQDVPVVGVVQERVVVVLQLGRGAWHLGRDASHDSRWGVLVCFLALHGSLQAESRPVCRHHLWQIAGHLPSTRQERLQD